MRLAEQNRDREPAEIVELLYKEADKVREEDLDVLAADAYADACRPGNPKDTNVEDLKALYRKIMA